MDAEQQEMIFDFVSESLEMLDTVEPLIIELNRGGSTDDVIDSVNTIFRLFHTLKGGAGFLNLDSIKKVTHAAENLLQHYRKSPESIDFDCVDILTRCSDLIRNLLEQVQKEYHDNGYEDEAKSITKELEQKMSDLLSHSNEVVIEDGAILPPEAETLDTKPEVASEEIEEAPSSPPEISIDLDDEEEPAEPPKNEETFDISGIAVTPEMMESFLQEADEQLEGTEGALLVVSQLGDDADSGEFIGTAFRNIHTLKGNSGFIGLEQIEHLSHKSESILDGLKNGSIPIKDNVIQLLLKVIDILRVGVKSVAGQKELVLPNYRETIRQLNHLTDTPQDGPPIPEPAPSPTPTETKPSTPPVVELTAPEPTAPVETPKPQPTPKPSPKPTSAPVSKPAAQTSASKAPPPAPKKQVNTPIKQGDIRVSIDKVDQLINLVGELVISEAMVVHNPDLEGLSIERFVKAARQLNKNVRDLQEVAMSMRMLPISGTFRKMIRVVHDVSKKVGKKVELRLVGEETEVDRTVVEQIADPLLHIIRNAVDHGIDTPEERAIAGKSETGEIVLEAKHAGNEIWITISDDGRGLNRDKILERAKDRELIPWDSEPPDSEVWKMIFLPGFSTAEQVTDFSGRGVGMDVVKKNIEKLHGRIDVTSEEGAGSNFLLRIPLTLAIIEGMLIRVGRSIYVIPIVGIRESLQPKEQSITKTSDGAEVVHIRDEFIRVVRLHQLHHLEPDSYRLEDGIVVVIEDEEERVCLFVDEVVGERQVVVKGLPQYFGDVPHLAGCTILGSGDISLILDILSIINSA